MKAVIRGALSGRSHHWLRRINTAKASVLVSITFFLAVTLLAIGQFLSTGNFIVRLTNSPTVDPVEAEFIVPPMSLVKVCEATLPETFSEFRPQPVDQGSSAPDEWPYIQGYGTATLAGNENLRNTDQFSMGILLHEGLRRSPLWTNNCSEAHAVLIPYDLASDELSHPRDPYIIKRKLKALFQPPNPLLPFFGAKPHLFSLSRIEKDFLRIYFDWGFDHLNEHVRNNVTYWTIEKKWGRTHDSVIELPYPSHVHFTEPTQSYPPDNFARDLLVFGTWSNRIRGLRPKLSDQCQQRPKNCQYYWPAVEESFSNSEAAAYYNRSIFCLSPPGDSPTRSAFYEAVVSGCINVLFQRNIYFPFNRWLNWEKMVVYLNESRLASENVVDILADIPLPEIRERQEYINEVRHALQYSLHPAWELINVENLSVFDPRDDAFTLALKDAFLYIEEQTRFRPFVRG